MNELSLREVTQENWRATLGLAVFPEQQRFIADYVPIAAIALAKAYIRPGGLVWVPYAFYAATEMVGFTELTYEPRSPDNYWIFHFFIDHHYQGRGYGTQALGLFLQFSGAIIRSARRSSSPSIQKIRTPIPSPLAHDFHQLDRY